MLSSDYGPLEQIGGPESSVYRGRGNDGRYVALRFSAVQGDDARAELIEIAQAASVIQHPMLAAVGGCQNFSGGALCIVSEYVPGQTLDRWIAEHGLPSLRITVDFIRRLCLGVHAAHQRGLIHPALHAGNLMVLQPDTQPDGRIVAKLLDLGTPGFVHDWPPRAEALPFVAPELLTTLEHTARPITPPMNVYSCGALLHYLCTGEAPLLGAAGSRLLAANDSDIPVELAQLITEALALDPGQRIPTAAELAAALGQLESAFRISGVYRRDSSPLELERARPATPPVPPAIMASQSMPPVAATGEGRVVARVPPPPTGSFPLVTIPPARRWAIATALVCMLALYAVWVWLATPPAPESPLPLALPAPVAAPAQPRASTINPNLPIRGEPDEADPKPVPAPRVSRAKPPRALRTGLSASDLAAQATPEPTSAEPETIDFTSPVPIANPKPIATEAEPPNGTAPATATTDAREPREARINDINVRGSLAVSVVRRAIERIRPLLTQCYQRHVQLNQPLPALWVSATIDEVGRVRNPVIQGAAAPALNACLVKATAKMVTEAPDTGTVRTTWRLEF